MTPSQRSRPRFAPLLVPLLAVLVVVAGCGGSSSSNGQGTTGSTPKQALALAKRHLDDAKSVQISLSTPTVPKKGNAVLAATGVGTHQPGFKGSVKVLLNGFSAEVPVVAVDGKVHAKLPLQSKYAVINPADYNAPDPATFMSPTNGLSSLLVELTGLKAGSQTRSGSQVLTSYTGTLAGADVARIIPSASKTKTYPTVVGISSDGYLSTVRITGSFFSGTGPATYTVNFAHYGQPVTISAP